MLGFHLKRSILFLLPQSPRIWHFLPLHVSYSTSLVLKKVACFDLEAACSGFFLYALDIADAMITSGRYRKALVVGAEKMSTIMDWEDRTTCVLFGDGAGAAVLSKEGKGPELLGFYCGADGSNPSLLCQPAGGSAMPASSESINARQHFLK